MRSHVRIYVRNQFRGTKEFFVTYLTRDVFLFFVNSTHMGIQKSFMFDKSFPQTSQLEDSSSVLIFVGSRILAMMLSSNCSLYNLTDYLLNVWLELWKTAILARKKQDVNEFKKKQNDLASLFAIFRSWGVFSLCRN